MLSLATTYDPILQSTKKPTSGNGIAGFGQDK